MFFFKRKLWLVDYKVKKRGQILKVLIYRHGLSITVSPNCLSLKIQLGPNWLKRSRAPPTVLQPPLPLSALWVPGSKLFKLSLTVRLVSVWRSFTAKKRLYCRHEEKPQLQFLWKRPGRQRWSGEGQWRWKWVRKSLFQSKFIPYTSFFFRLFCVV